MSIYVPVLEQTF